MSAQEFVFCTDVSFQHTFPGKRFFTMGTWIIVNSVFTFNVLGYFLFSLKNGITSWTGMPVICVHVVLNSTFFHKDLVTWWTSKLVMRVNMILKLLRWAEHFTTVLTRMLTNVLAVFFLTSIIGNNTLDLVLSIYVFADFLGRWECPFTSLTFRLVISIYVCV